MLRHALPLWLPGKVRVGRRTVVLGLHCYAVATAKPSLTATVLWQKRTARTVARQAAKPRTPYRGTGLPRRNAVL